MSAEKGREVDGATDRRAWLGLGVLGAATLLLSIDLSVLHLALPALVADLRPSPTQLLWITDVYGFLIAGLLVPMGALGDRIGRRRLLLVGASAFAAASTAAAFAPSPELLIAARAVMGAAGATIMPSALALVSTLFPDPRRRGTAIAAFMACFTAGMAIGPVVGGAVLEHYWWGSVFLLGLPVIALVLGAGPLLLAEHRGDGHEPIDLPSAALFLGTVLLVVAGLKELAADGPSLLGTGLAAAGVVLGAQFFARQRRLTHPLVDLALFARPAFRVALIGMLVATVVMGGIGLFVTQYLQLVAGLSPWSAGLWLIVPALGVVVGSMGAPSLSRLLGAGPAVATGLAVAAVGFTVLAFVGPQTGPALLITGYTLAFLGVGPAGVLGTDLVLASAPADRAGAASAISETTGELGIGLGIAVLGSVGTAVFRLHSGGTELTDHAGTVLPAPAQEAFSTALGVVAICCAVLAASAAAIIARRLRRSASTDAADDHVGTG